ncbi:AMP-binding protein [Halomonas sp. FME1]|uniref:AMP-binding protein n=1 Tax=Halomonas casei TaxID=2742613 RepID=A0ABR9F1N8_9GAMM|nr:AMP-binding protein [Halomonas casei]PCC20763.1 hypothetical protein CIK78_00950 [Halomonas sp. JB37]
MTFISLTQLPWRNLSFRHECLPNHWVCSASLALHIDEWHLWLADKPAGRWLLCQQQPLAFCAALIALWESGRVAVLPADDRPGTLSRLASEVDGTLPDAPGPRLAKSAETRPRVVPLDPSATAVVLSTSGSTGNPVQLAKRFDQLDAELSAHAQLWPLTDSGVISQVSHQHIYGLLTGILHPLCTSTPFCGGESRYPETLVTRLQEASAAGLHPVVVSSPAQLSRLPEHLAWHAATPPARVFSSGAPLSQAHAQLAERLLQAPVIEIYGSTETGGIAQRRQTSHSAWQPLPGVALAFQDGGLSLRSPFLEMPQQWWHQPDLVAPVDDGFMLLGRADRLVKIGGRRVSLDHVECLLTALEEVSEARCVDLDRTDGRLGAVVVLEHAFIPHQRDARQCLIQRLRAHLFDHLEPVAVPRYWRFVETVPSNTQGKLDRTLINRLFADLDDPKEPRWLGEHLLDANSCLLTLEVPERLAFLEGHFDEYPIVPGVVMVQWAIHYAHDIFGHRGLFLGIERLKFTRALLPGTRFTLQLTRREDGIAFSIDSQEGRHCAGQVRLQAPKGGQHG